jgi:uncharacterized protein with predicted RNA binding PUA domain
MHTVNLAPSITALIGSEWILRPQTSHLNVNVHLSLSLLSCYVYTCRNNKKVNDGEDMENALGKVRSVADYQFGKGVGSKLFPENIEVQYSPRTGRIRYINLDGERLATLRPTDGLLSLSLKAAVFMAENTPFAKCFVTVQNDVSKYIAAGGDVFAVHVVKVDAEVGAKDEVIVLDENGQVLAVGRATLSSQEIAAFKTGVAVKVRHGSKKS